MLVPRSPWGREGRGGWRKAASQQQPVVVVAVAAQPQVMMMGAHQPRVAMVQPQVVVAQAQAMAVVAPQPEDDAWCSRSDWMISVVDRLRLSCTYYSCISMVAL